MYKIRATFISGSTVIKVFASTESQTTALDLLSNYTDAGYMCYLQTPEPPPKTRRKPYNGG